MTRHAMPARAGSVRRNFTTPNHPSRFAVTRRRRKHLVIISPLRTSTDDPGPVIHTAKDEAAARKTVAERAGVLGRGEAMTDQNKRRSPEQRVGRGRERGFLERARSCVVLPRRRLQQHRTLFCAGSLVLFRESAAPAEARKRNAHTQNGGKEWRRRRRLV